MRRGTPSSLHTLQRERKRRFGRRSGERDEPGLPDRLPETADRHPEQRAPPAGARRARSTISAPYSVSTSTPRLRSTPNPLLPTVTAMAAPMPNGANFITIPTNLNITSLRLSHAVSMNVFAGPCTWDSATAKMIAKKTIWSTSFFDAASKKLCGTVCSITPAQRRRACSRARCRLPRDASGEVHSQRRASRRSPRASPTTSASVVTSSK